MDTILFQDHVVKLVRLDQQENEVQSVVQVKLVQLVHEEREDHLDLQENVVNQAGQVWKGYVSIVEFLIKL